MTLLEVLFALGILGIVLAMFMTSFVSTLRQDASSGQRTQAVRVLDYLGRLVVNNDSRLVPDDAGGGGGIPFPAWNYGDLGTNFQELSDNGFGDPANYRATVLPLEVVTFESVSMVHYQVEVCWQTSQDESCVIADTIAPPLTSAGSRPEVSW